MMASIRIGFASCVASMLILSASVSRASYITTHLEFPSPKYRGSNSVEYPTASGVVRVGRSNDFFDVFLEPPSFSLAPFPPAGAPPQINSFFDIFTEFDLTPPGGMPTSRHGITQMTTSAVRLNGLPPGEPVLFNTEMLQLNIAGGTMPPAVMIRESPTKASLGKTSVADLGGGLYRIDSFFDVFTELSIDGGQNWTPGNSALRIVGVSPEPASAVLALLGCAIVGRVVRKRR
jgi:hypothetical protein